MSVPGPCTPRAEAAKPDYDLVQHDLAQPIVSVMRLLRLVALVLTTCGLVWWLAPTATDRGARPELAGSSIVPAEHPATPEIPPAPARVPLARGPQSGSAAPLLSELSIQVVDVEGVPLVGVPLGIRSTTSAGGDFDLMNATTAGAEGIARFEGVRDQLFSWQGRGGVLAHVDALGFERIGELVDPTKLQPKPARITLPAYGSIEVHVQDAGGNPIRSSWLVLADALAPSSLEQPSMAGHAIMSMSNRSGSAVFDFVALGHEVKVSATARFESAEVCGSGPRTAGERVAFVLTLARPDIRVIGRFVNEESQPIAGCTFMHHLQIDPVPGTDSETYFGGGGGMGSTDHEGRFRLTIPRLKGSLSLRLNGPEYSDCPGLSVNLVAEQSSGTMDLGDIVIQAKRELISGRAIDDIGNPISFALIFGEIRADTAHGPAWNYEYEISGHSNRDGTFNLSGPTVAGRIQLRATKHGYVDTESDGIVPGATNVWLTLTRSARIEGKLVLDEVGASQRLWAHVLRGKGGLDPSAQALVRDRALVDHDASFLLPNVWPGVCDLAIFIEGDPSPVARIEGLVFKPGETSTDSRLEAIDLRGKIAAPAPADSKEH